MASSSSSTATNTDSAGSLSADNNNNITTNIDNNKPATDKSISKMTNPLLVRSKNYHQNSQENTLMNNPSTTKSNTQSNPPIDFIDSIFDTYSSINKDINPNEKILNYENFINLLNSEYLKHNDLIYLSKIASYIPFDLSNLLYLLNDTQSKGYISKSDFKKFSIEFLLPNQKLNNQNFNYQHNDLDLDINKLLFFLCKKYETLNSVEIDNNLNENSTLSKDNFLSLVKNYNIDDFKYLNSLLYDIDNSIDFHHFTKIMDELPKLKLKHLFSIFTNENNSSHNNITPEQLKQITQNIFYNKLSPKVADHLELFALNKYGNNINYEDTYKTIKMIRDLPKLNYLTFEKVTNDKSHNPKFYLSVNSLYNYINNNSVIHNISKDEIILYFNWNKFTNDHIKNNPSINPIELLAVLTDDMVVISNENSPSLSPSSSPSSINLNFNNIFNSIHNFILGSFAGMIGATLVYPIDIVKTRMQNQKNNSVYSSYIDCFRKLIKNEGIIGLYSGLLPQIIGVAPEKAIKLVLNDLIRNFGKKQSKNGDITLPWEILAGTTAGLCQVIVTNPLEVSKIRLQTQGEYIKQLKDNGKIINSKSAIEIVRELGFKGLYRGAGACLLRDIPFSGIYFPTYANIKKHIFNLDPNNPNKRSNLEPWELLTSGALAGMPAALLTTPCDVIKTRIQTKPSLNQKPYLGIIPTFKRILFEEGPKAFFKGGIARICRSSPQFGFTLAAYELFQKTLPLELFYGSSSNNLNNLNNIKSNSVSSSSISLSDDSKRFKLSSSASSADLNPTLLALTNYYKFIEQDSKNNK
ncbi:mitochondrial aspartate-glutamate transporter agc1 [Pichia californica]|uniref:Mitochondrial aspartate-glutamate transporter AGC1 n=1 Tax=Pichia californica TaxID=460514 RepID=A0A9P7BHR3_9ASCO|nr:mitochondrial aspartate-glutamate transporter agc1 [[Candida] californica]